MPQNINVAIVGSHGYKAQRGGWDQLVNNLCLRKCSGVDYTIYNPKDNVSECNVERRESSSSTSVKKFWYRVFDCRCFGFGLRLAS